MVKQSDTRESPRHSNMYAWLLEKVRCNLLICSNVIGFWKGEACDQNYKGEQRYEWKDFWEAYQRRKD